MLFIVIPLAAQVGIGACKAARMPRWGLVPSKLLLFVVILLQATRRITIWNDLARCAGGDWRPQRYQAADWGLALTKLAFGVDAGKIVCFVKFVEF